MTEFERLQRNWTALGEEDPLWAILTVPGKRGSGWDLEQFFATGRADVDQILRELADIGVVVERGRALDVGCGVGRLTRALADHFDSCDGVDAAASMIEHARELHKDREHVRFQHNDAPDLQLFGDQSFDFILALIVLRHMTPELMRGYLREFVRLLRPGGVAYVQIPEGFMPAEALPPEACLASLTLVGEVPPLFVRRVARLRVRVRNVSPMQWPVSAQVRVGNHWRSPDGKVVMHDYARTQIDRDVDPGQACELQLDVFAPDRSGDYELEVDLVQEMVAWFADRGSPTLRLPVTVAAEPEERIKERAAERPRRAETENGGPGEFTSRIEMHAMAREDVVATVENAGGVVLGLIAKDRSGPLTQSTEYVIARAPTRSQSENHDPQSPIEARIRRMLQDSGHASRARAKQLLSVDPERFEKRARALRSLQEHRDLTSFAFTSTLKGMGSASIVFRGALRRALFQVLHRQTEHNMASDELLRGQETRLEALTATVRAQIDLQSGIDERLDALDRRLPPVDVNSRILARQTARESGRVGPSKLD